MPYLVEFRLRKTDTSIEGDDPRLIPMKFVADNPRKSRFARVMAGHDLTLGHPEAVGLTTGQLNDAHFLTAGSVQEFGSAVVMTKVHRFSVLVRKGASLGSLVYIGQDVIDDHFRPEPVHSTAHRTVYRAKCHGSG